MSEAYMNNIFTSLVFGALDNFLRGCSDISPLLSCLPLPLLFTRKISVSKGRTHLVLCMRGLYWKTHNRRVKKISAITPTVYTSLHRKYCLLLYRLNFHIEPVISNTL